MTVLLFVGYLNIRSARTTVDQPMTDETSIAVRPQAVSQEQREALDGLLREGPLDLGGDVSQQRAIFDEMMAAIPVPDDVAASPGSLGGISVTELITRRSRVRIGRY
jgi:hypothetical protein